ncbi:hypothetical protein Tco_0590803 [Tanacetum coccineum]
MFFLDSLCPVSYSFDPVTGGRLSWSGTQSCAKSIPCGVVGLFGTVRVACSLRSCGVAELVLPIRLVFRGVRIVKTVHLSLSRSFDGRRGHVSPSKPARVGFLVVGPELPGRDDTIKDAPAGKMGIYTRFLEFANFRIPWSRFLLRVLEYYQINFSQLSVLGAAKDPLPSDNYVNAELLGLLDHHRTIIRRYPKTFLCLVGLSLSFDDVHVRPTLLKDDDSDMGLLDFVKSADPFKVKTRERTLAQGEVPLNNETMNMTVPPSVEIVQIELPVKRLRADAAVASEVVPTTGGKSPAALRRLESQSRPQGVGSSFVPPVEEFVSSSVTPTPEPDVPEDSGSNQDRGIQMHHASIGIVVSFSYGPDDDVSSPRAEPHAGVGDTVVASARGIGASGGNVEAPISVPDHDSPDDFFDSQTVETATADDIYVLRWGVTNGARIHNHAICRNLQDHHTCMVTELRLQYEHKVMTREKFQKKFTDNCVVVQQCDANIAALKTRLEEAKREAVEVVALRSHVSELEARMAVKSEETRYQAGSDCERLRKEAVGEAKLREEFKSFQDAEARRFEQRSAELDARIADVMCDMDNDLYPHMFTAIARQRWILNHGVRLAVMKCAQSTECRFALGKVISLAINKGIQEGLEAGIEHRKSGRTLAQVEAYDPGVKDEFISDVTDFENVSFALLDELESLKDSPLASIMSALSGSVSGEMLLSEVVPTACAAMKRRGLCLPPLDGPSSSAPLMAHDDLFDRSVLDGAGGT